jgi:hypothetical protein
MLTINIEDDPLLKEIYDRGAADFDPKPMWLKSVRKAAERKNWFRKDEIVAKLETLSGDEVEAFVGGLIGSRDQDAFRTEWIAAHLD